MVECSEFIMQDEEVLALIIRSSLVPSGTVFLTPPDWKQQVGYIVYPRGGVVPRHLHVPLERHLVGTSEVIMVKEGQCEVDIYNDEMDAVATRLLRPGDLVVIVSGGHGFRMIEDTVLLEIKQGPYTGMVEKKVF